jgi:outer membrane protein assembly factor BamB
MRRVLPVACLILALGGGGFLPAAPDWPQWRGPNRDGVVVGVRGPAKWPKALKEEWKVIVGEGVASPVVAGGKAYVFTREKGHEVVRCIDLKAGKVVWRSVPYPAPFKPGPGDGFNIGPRSTPAVAGGRVFALGISGVLSCLDAGTGKLLWRKDYRPPFHRSGNSPLVTDGLVVAHLGTGANGGLRAFDAATGEVKWCFHNEHPASSSPIVAELAGERQVVTFTARELLGVSLATGRLLWRTPCSHVYFENCVTPVQYRDLIIASGRMGPPLAFRLEKGARGLVAKEAWRAEGHPSYMSSPVLAGDWLVGHADQRAAGLFCLDARTGKTLWQSKGRPAGAGDYVSILNAGSAWLVLTSRGQLTVVRPSGRAYEPIATYRVSDAHTYAHPVFLGDRLLIKDERTLRCLRIEDGPTDR